jgi:glycine/D-amino acid oxidase-like deaminating enzyme
MMTTIAISGPQTDQSELPNLRRRGILGLGSAAAGLGLLQGCATPLLVPPNYKRPYSNRPFVRPIIREEEVIRTRVGLRPYRASGFVVRAERLGETLVIHNYGHGGGGITMSWGSSALAVRELPDIADKRAVVLGCGVMGLTTARLLQQRGWQVTVYAKELPPDTTSNVAGGQWAPTSVARAALETPAFSQQFDEALRISYQTFEKQLGRDYGVSWIENYFLLEALNERTRPSYIDRWPSMFPDQAILGPEEHPFPAKQVLRFRTMLIEPAIFLPKLMAEILAAGGTIAAREIQTREELVVLGAPVVFNCTGLGAKALFGDNELTPIRGQLVFVPRDDRVDYITHGGVNGGDGLLYMFPREDGILLGGAYERDATHLTPDAETSARIIHEHARMAAEMRV